MGEEDRIVLRSKPNDLSLLHTSSIMSNKIEVEMVVGRVVIPNIFPLKGVHHPSFVHASRSRSKKAWQWSMQEMAVAVPLMGIAGYPSSDSRVWCLSFLLIR